MKQSNFMQLSETDWNRLAAMDDELIDLSDIPEISPELFTNAVVRQGLRLKQQKSKESVQLDCDIINWFKNQGQDYQAIINALLRAHMNAHCN